MNRLLDVTLRHRRAVLALWAVLFLAGGVSAAGLNDKIVPGGIAPGSSESQRVADELERASTSRTLFAVLRWDDAQSPALLQRRARDLTRELRGVEGVIAVTPVRAGPAGDPGGRVTAVRIATRGDTDGAIKVAKRLHEDRDELTPRGAELLLGGLGAYNRELTELTRSDLARAERVGLPIVFVILLLTFGSLWAALVPLAIALPAVVIGLGAVGLLANGIDVSEYVTNASTMIGVALGVDYAMFLVQRLREQLASGVDVEEAIRGAMNTTGVAVLWSGATVIVAEATLLLVDARAMRSAAVGMMLVTFVATASAIVLGPVIFSLMGKRIVRASFLRRAAAAPSAESRRWTAWATRVTRRAPLFLALSAVVMVALAIPTKDLRDSVDVQTTSVLPEDSNVRQAYETAAAEFGPGAMTPVLVVARGAPADAQRIAGEIRGDGRVAAVGRPAPLGRDGPFVLEVAPRGGAYDERTRDLVTSLREGSLARTLRDTSYDVGGETAVTIDTKKEMFDRLPSIVGLLVAMVSLLLLFAFRSVFLAFKAAVLVVLTLAASLGGLLLLTQTDLGATLIGAGDPLDIHPLVPLTIVAIVMALTTDYEVLLLSRVAERYRVTGDNDASVIYGMGRTGRVITSAAAIMIAVFFGFALADLPTLKYLGIGLALSVFLDATIVRGVMVPAAMQLMGSLNWWRPKLRSRPPKQAPPAA